MSDAVNRGTNDGWTTAHSAAAASIVLLGWALRTIQYLANPSLWNDEELLALNIGRRSALALLRPLGHDQSAPVGFLELERFITRVFGMGDMALRLLPYLAGLAVAALGVLLVRRLVSPGAALLAALFFAFSPSAIGNARELKPYELDAAVAALLLWLALRLFDDDTPASWRALTIAGVLATWFSSPALFMVAALVVALAAAPQFHADAQWRRRTMLASGAMLASAAVVYVAFLRPSAASGYLQHYMEAQFLPRDGHLFARAFTLYNEELLTVSVLPAATLLRFRAIHAALMLALAVAGIVIVARRRGLGVAALLAVPFAISFGTALLRMYPVVARLQLWLLPALVALVVISIDAAVKLLPRPQWRIAALSFAAVIVLATSGRAARYRVFNVTATQNARPLLEAWRGRDPTTPVYVSARGAPAWTFYSTDWSRPDTARIDWFVALNGSTGRAFRNAAGVGHVSDDAPDLVWRDSQRTELLGLPSGVQVTLGGLSQPAPDSGWADNEARRIRAAANPQAWVFMGNHMRSEHHAILDAVRAAGGTAVETFEEAGAALYLVRF